MTDSSPYSAAAAPEPTHERTVTITMSGITDRQFVTLSNDLWNCANSAGNRQGFTISAKHNAGPALDT